MKKGLLFSVCVIFLIFLVFVFSLLAFGDVFSGEEKTISLVMIPWAGFSPAFAAYEFGFFEDEGVLVKLDIFKDSNEIEAKILGGDFEYDGIFGTFIDALWFADNGFDYRIVYVTDYSQGSDAIVSSPDIESILDLRGKTVGVEYEDSFGHLFLLYYLEQVNLTEKDVFIITVPVSEVAEKIESGEIDAGYVWEPYKNRAIESGLNVLVTSRNFPVPLSDVLMLRGDVIRDNEEDVQNLIDGLFISSDYIFKNSGRVYSRMSNKTGVSLDELVTESNGMILASYEDNIISFTESENPKSLHKQLEFILPFMSRNGVVDSEISMEDIVESKFVLKSKFNS